MKADEFIRKIDQFFCRHEKEVGLNILSIEKTREGKYVIDYEPIYIDVCKEKE